MKIPVSKPFVGQLEVEYSTKAVMDSAISGIYGSYLDEFESEFASFCGTKYAVTCSNGTTALHLGMAAAGIMPGDEVLVSTLTNMATFFAVLYLGAKPIPIDIDPDTLTLNPDKLKEKITSKTRGIMVVHLFGHPTDMDPVTKIAKEYNLLVFEDCAEAHGAEYKGRKVGSLGSVGCFSFFANKIITTGEGGMITTDNESIANKARSLKNLACGATNRFMHDTVGFNYRMTNVQAALGCAQMKNVSHLVEKRIKIAEFYNNELSNFDNFLILPKQKPWAKNVIWMYLVRLKGELSCKRELITSKLREEGVDTRDGFIPFNLQEIFIKDGSVKAEDCPHANLVSSTSFYLPTSAVITDKELQYVADTFKHILGNMLK